MGIETPEINENEVFTWLEKKYTKIQNELKEGTTPEELLQLYYPIDEVDGKNSAYKSLDSSTRLKQVMLKETSSILELTSKQKINKKSSEGLQEIKKQKRHLTKYEFNKKGESPLYEVLKKIGEKNSIFLSILGLINGDTTIDSTIEGTTNQVSEILARVPNTPKNDALGLTKSSYIPPREPNMPGDTYPNGPNTPDKDMKHEPHIPKKGED